MCILIRHILCESLMKLCPTKHIFFSEIGQSFRPAQKSLENQKSGHIWIVLDNNGSFSKYFEPFHKLV